MVDRIRPQLEADIHEGEGIPVVRPVPSEVTRPQLMEDIGGLPPQGYPVPPEVPMSDMD